MRMFFVISVFLSLTSYSQAVQLDWKGQFWFDNHVLNNTQLDRGRVANDADPVYYNTGSPYVPGTGEKTTIWYSAFLRLKPKIIVNDSIQLKSEWHLGSPIYGFMGRDFASSGGEQYNFTGAQKNGAAISAMRFWANFITDFGTFEVGRAPIHWALGSIWNSGDELFDRYQSTADLFRVTSKFGNLIVSPFVSKISMGNSVGGALDNAATTANFPSLANPKPGNDDVTDYNVAVKYDNTEEDFDFGLMWTRRTGNAAQSSLLLSPTSTGSTRLNYNLLDFYARKKIKRFSFGIEVPFYTGTIGGVDGSANDFEYKTVAAIFEGRFTSDQWDILLKGGYVPGQPDVAAADPATPTNNFIESGAKYRPVYLHKNYGLGLIMFKYNLWGLSANNPGTMTGDQLRSPYDNPIVNAMYISVNPTYKLDKWSFNLNLIAAWAPETAPDNPAGNSPRKFYNHQRRQFFSTAASAGAQSSFMGWETDAGAAFHWDDNFVLDWTFGFFLPGDYFKFSNRSGDSLNTGDFMFASQIRGGITF